MAVVRKIPCVVRGDHRSRRARLHASSSSRRRRSRGSSRGSSCTWRSIRTTAPASGRSRGCSRSPARPRDRDRLTITYAVKGAFTTRMERELVAGRRRLGQAAVRRVRGRSGQGRGAVRGRDRHHRVHGVPAVAHARARDRASCSSTAPGRRTSSSTAPLPRPVPARSRRSRATWSARRHRAVSRSTARGRRSPRCMTRSST